MKEAGLLGGLVILLLFLFMILGAFNLPDDSNFNKINPLNYFKIWFLESEENRDNFMQITINVLLAFIVVSVVVGEYRRRKILKDKIKKVKE